jgi:Leucine-rich repeat (LRR) protein
MLFNSPTSFVFAESDNEIKQIKEIKGLRSLYALKQLNLSYNEIRSLKGVTEVNGDQYQIEVLDLKCNGINNIKELENLAGLTVSLW